jgi:hypothetical protein
MNQKKAHYNEIIKVVKMCNRVKAANIFDIRTEQFLENEA